MNENLLCTVCIIALNEEKTLPALLDLISAQTYPHNRIQLLLVDSCSTDRTRNIMQDFASSSNDFDSVLVLDNPKKILPAGWNVALEAAQGDVIVRLDAHARIPHNFLMSVTEVLAEGENVVGGSRPTIVPDNATPWQHTLLVAEDSLFGASIAKYRRGASAPADSGADNAEKAALLDLPASPAQYVNSVFHPTYRREVLDEVGKFDERLVRTEDNDYSYRIRQAGYKIRFDPRIQSEQIIRPNLKAMTKQKYANGYWIGRTLFIQPGCIEMYHLVPAAFVAAIVGAGSLALAKKSLPAKLLTGTYAAATSVMSIAGVASSKKRNLTMAALPAIFPILHIAYGVGTWKGIVTEMLNAGKRIASR